MFNSVIKNVSLDYKVSYLRSGPSHTLEWGPPDPKPDSVSAVEYSIACR